jgi:hypothetical protein
MRSRFTSWVFVATCGLLCAAASHATRVLDAPPPTAQAVRKSALPAAPSQADDSSGLRQGIVTAVSDKGERVQIQGVWLRVIEGQTKLFTQGRATNIGALSKGQAVSFTLAPGDSTRSTLGAVYVR